MSDQREFPNALSRACFWVARPPAGWRWRAGRRRWRPPPNPPPRRFCLHWMNMTSENMPQIIKDVKGVCLVPWGCLERHGPHLPLGTDTIESGSSTTPPSIRKTCGGSRLG